MVISSFTRTQIAALFGTAILTVMPATQFSGMLTPVSSLSGAGAIIGHVFPMTYFLRISVGTFTKGLGFMDLGCDLVALAAFIPALTLLSLLSCASRSVARGWLMRRDRQHLLAWHQRASSLQPRFRAVALVIWAFSLVDRQHRAEQFSGPARRFDRVC